MQLFVCMGILQGSWIKIDIFLQGYKDTVTQEDPPPTPFEPRLFREVADAYMESESAPHRLQLLTLIVSHYR